ncbi:succinate dehydrogenase assembly factor 2, partial [Salmonella enterica subsp. enterica serovar Anatum]|nr:succinate dehydrogenase assembly factor 2 [Salmonella enterica subsp. enterica serovar Anatum]
MDIHNKARIHWACRRGMRELDISIMPFFEHEYDSLSAPQTELTLWNICATVSFWRNLHFTATHRAFDLSFKLPNTEIR